MDLKMVPRVQSKTMEVYLEFSEEQFFIIIRFSHETHKNAVFQKEKKSIWLLFRKKAILLMSE